CGGSCGECELGFACEPGGTCQPNGDTCAGALEVGALPFTLQGNGAGLTDSTSCELDSTTTGAGTPDQVLAFSIPTNQVHRATLQGSEGATISILSDCDQPDSCLARGPSGEEVAFQPPASGTVFVVVEDPSASSFEVLIESCVGACTPNFCGIGKCGIQCSCADDKICQDDACLSIPGGDSCASPVEVVSFPFSASGVLSLHSDDISSNIDCGGVQSENLVDVTYRLNSSTDVGVAVTLNGDAGTIAYPTHSCSGAPACESIVSAGESMGISLQGGVPLRLIVEGPTDGSYGLTVSPCDAGNCSPECPCGLGQSCTAGSCEDPTTGDDCDSGLVLGLGTVDHSTAALTDTQSCVSTAPLKDAVFSFTASTDGLFGFEATAGRPLSIYSLDTCGDPQTCATNASAPPTIKLQLIKDQTVTIAVEEVIPGPGGAFSLEAADCGLACQDAPCDAVVCGSTCGCSDAEVCVNSACIQSIPLDSCATAKTIDSVPANETGHLSDHNDFVGCTANSVGVGNPDAIYTLVAPKTAIYSIGVTGLGTPLVLLPKVCAAGAQTCSSAPGTTQVVFLHAGDERPVVVDSAAGEGADYTLSVAIVTGYPGSLGAACSGPVDCPFADACVAGVCTNRCSDLDGGCTGAVDGPRGSEFGCGTGPCDGDCEHWCIAGAENVGASACTSNTQCGELGCVGYLPDSANEPAGYCAASGTLKAGLATCAEAAECASNQCHDGKCTNLCQADADCDSTARCHLHLLPTESVDELPVSYVARGLCRTVSDGYGPACDTNASCGSGSCQIYLSPDGGATSYCQGSVGSATDGSACSIVDDCISGRCMFADSGQGYCSSPCPTSTCGGELACRTWTAWDHGTTETADDFILSLCLKGSPGSPCALWGVPPCNPSLTCAAISSDPLLGSCL
ncbi:MAG: hypothetical protein ACI9OJ_005266, partial [Myxococcota bacterium]